MLSKFKVKLFSSIFALLFLLVKFSLPDGAAANMADPSHGGALGAEPSGLEEVYILGETLDIDLRSLENNASGDNQRIGVEAIYEVENRGAEKKLELVFAFGSSFKDFQIWLDEQEVGSQSISNANLPKSWKPPVSTPRSDGGTLSYSVSSRHDRAQGFFVTLPAGKHRLKARYQAIPSYFDGNPVKSWQFAYVLAPVREWAGFGGLDVTIHAPKDWTVTTSPVLERSGDTLRGRFDQIPADALALTAVAPVPVLYGLLDVLLNVLFALALFAFPVLIAVFAWRRGCNMKWSWLVGIGLAVLWTISIVATGFFASFGANYAIPDNQFSSSGYVGIFHIFGSLIAGAAAFFIGITLWFFTVYLAAKKKTPR